MDDNVIIWAVNPDTSSETIKLVHGRIEKLGVKIKEVTKSEITTILENVQHDTKISSTWMYTPDIDSLSFPIYLERRIFWLSKEFSVPYEIDVEMAGKLLAFKYTYETLNGFDNMTTSEMKMHSTELKSLLLDVLTIRGAKMLDLGFSGKTINLYMRFREYNLESADMLAAKYIKEFQKIILELQQL